MTRDARGRFRPATYIWSHPSGQVDAYNERETEVRVLEFLPLSGYSYQDSYGQHGSAAGHVVVVVEEVKTGRLRQVAVDSLRRKP